MAGKKNAKVKTSQNNLTENVETKHFQTSAQTQQNTLNGAGRRCERMAVGAEPSLLAVQVGVNPQQLCKAPVKGQTTA
jgi:hypothetical protein